MPAPIAIANFALKPLKSAEASFRTNTWSGLFTGKLLLVIQSVVSLVAIPIILGLGILETLVRACKAEGWMSLNATLQKTIVLIGLHGINALVSLTFGIYGDQRRCDTVNRNNLIKVTNQVFNKNGRIYLLRQRLF